MKKESSKNIFIRESFLNMPQMAFNGLSENWLLKESGDMHWAMLCSAFNCASDALEDSEHNRLYSSFVRIRTQSSVCLQDFKENEKITFNGQLSRFGLKMFFSDNFVQSADKNIKTSMMTVFVARHTDNKSLTKAAPVNSDKADVKTLAALPSFAKEYLEIKKVILEKQEAKDSLVYELGDQNFSLAEENLFETTYQINPFTDLNGVNLLYFASYPQISDTCEREYFNSLKTEIGIKKDSALTASPLSRDVLYFANCDVEDIISFKIDSCEFIENNKVKISSSLLRKKDNRLMAKIFTLKKIKHAKNKKYSVKSPVLPAPALYDSGLNIQNLLNFFIEFFAQVLEIEKNRISKDFNIKRYGIDSIILMELSERLHIKFGIQLDPAQFYEFLTINDICESLVKKPANKGSREKFIPFSYSQKHLFKPLIEPEHPAYTVYLAFKIKNELNIESLKKAFQDLSYRHPILRACIDMKNNEPVNRIMPDKDLDFFEIIDAKEKDSETIQRQIEASIKTPFNFAKGPLAKITIWKRSSSDYVLLFAIHHLIVDGWSLWLFLNELGILYQAKIKGKKADLPEVKKSFEDYVIWHSKILQSKRGKELEAFWLKKFSGKIPKLNLPLDYKRPERKTHNGSSVNFTISEAKTAALKKLAGSKQMTLYSVLMTAYCILIYNYTKQEDIIVASPTNGRGDNISFSKTAGLISSRIFLSVQFEKNFTFDDAIKKINSEIAESLKYQNYPTVLLAKHLNIPQSLVYRDMFRTMFALQKPQIKDITRLLTRKAQTSSELWHGLDAELIPLPCQGAHYDIDLEIFETFDVLHSRITYNSDLFKQGTVKQMCSDFQIILDMLIKDANAGIDIRKKL